MQYRLEKEMVKWVDGMRVSNKYMEQIFREHLLPNVGRSIPAKYAGSRRNCSLPRPVYSSACKGWGCKRYR